MHYARIILGGLLLGAALYFAPWFAVRFFLFGILIFAAIRFLIGPRWGRGPWAYAGPGMHGYGPLGFADKVRAMSADEYKTFQERFSNPGYGYGCRGGHGHRYRPAPAQAAGTPPTENHSNSNA